MGRWLGVAQGGRALSAKAGRPWPGALERQRKSIVSRLAHQRSRYVGGPVVYWGTRGIGWGECAEEVQGGDGDEVLCVDLAFVLPLDSFHP